MEVSTAQNDFNVVLEKYGDLFSNTFLIVSLFCFHTMKHCDCVLYAGRLKQVEFDGRRYYGHFINCLF